MTNTITKLHFNGVDYNVGAANVHELTEKTNLVWNDEFLVADSENTYQNKKVNFWNLYFYINNIMEEPTDLEVITVGTTAFITWTDPDDLRTIPSTSVFSKSVLVRKVGSAPTSPTDWTVVIEETTRNDYKTSKYSDAWLTKDVDYYYRVFTYSTAWTITYWDAVVTDWRQWLCFTANNDNSTIQLTKTWSPTAVTLEISTDGDTRTTYTIWTTITLAEAWDKLYIRNTSTTDTRFSTAGNVYYKFVMSGSIEGSWDVTYLLNKNWTTALSDYCFMHLFDGCTCLTKTPRMPATSLAEWCYTDMFNWCTNLIALPTLSATAIWRMSYARMFQWCTKIKLSTTQTWKYQTPYRIPTTWTWTTGFNALINMFTSTWWTFVWEPAINTTYYTSNAVI